MDAFDRRNLARWLPCWIGCVLPLARCSCTHPPPLASHPAPGSHCRTLRRFTPCAVPLLRPVPDRAARRRGPAAFTAVAGSPVFGVMREDAAAGSVLASRTPGGLHSPQLSVLRDHSVWIPLAGKPQDKGLRFVADA